LSSLLDTNVVSQRIKTHPDHKVVNWLSQLPEEDAFLSVVTLQELRTGIELLPAGRKRRDLDSWLVADIRRGYAGRILPITEEIADVSGRLIAKGKKEGAIPEANDALLAATAIVHGLQLATLNRKHFERLGVELVEF
jgi:predicted nucleic acid-binding protein